MNLITCESVVAVTVHLRDSTDVAPNYGGHHPRPNALCGATVAWDTRLPITAARCRACLERLKRMRGSE